MKKYHIITFGCQMNKSDSERIASFLNRKGMKQSPLKQADLVIVNMCSVRQKAADRVYGKVNQLKKLKCKTILTGCILKKDREKLKKHFNQILDIKELPNWFGKSNSCSYLKIPPLYSSFPCAFVPVSTGCNNFCAYCCVPQTRGKEKQRPRKDIIKEVKTAISKGFKEIWLLGENVNSYKNFSELLKKINSLKGNFWIRFTSPNPKDFSLKLIKTISKCEKLTPYLNLPLQSGDNKILKKMNRNYTRENYLKLVRTIKKQIPDISLSTDIIVGFPTETEQAFQNTKKVMEKVKFDMAYVSQYSERHGTAACLLKNDVPKKEKQRRESVLTKALEKTAKQNNKRFLNKIVKVLPMEYKKGFLFGKSLHYKTVKFKGGKELIGKFCNVKITKTDSFGLKGELPKLIVILGQTAAGKTSLSIKLAKKFNGEIVSADSRQVYKKMDIGTGKATKKEMQGIPHYLLSIISPKKTFSVADYQKLAKRAIKTIIEKGKLPFLVGGSAFYIYALTEGMIFPEMKKNKRLRKTLEKKSKQELFKMLKRLDPKRAETIEKENKRRLIRAIEIATLLGKVPSLKKAPEYNCLFLGIKKENINELIHQRLIKRLRQGMIKEVENLRKSGVSFKKLDSFGLEYRWIARYLQKKITKQEMTEKLENDIKKFAKRQMTWFKKDKRILWIKNQKQAERLVKGFLREKA